MLLILAIVTNRAVRTVQYEPCSQNCFRFIHSLYSIVGAGGKLTLTKVTIC